MSQSEKLHSLDPYSLVEHKPIPYYMHQKCFVLGTFFTYVIVDTIASSLDYTVHGTNLLSLFYADFLAALCFLAYALSGRTTTKNQGLLTYYFFLVGWFLPLLPLRQWALDWTWGQRAWFAFDYGVQGQEVSYCLEGRWQDDFIDRISGYPITNENELIWWCNEPYGHSKVWVNVLSIGLVVYLGASYSRKGLESSTVSLKVKEEKAVGKV